MSLGKRKADVSVNGPPSKKSAHAAPPQVKVIYREGPKAARPVVATTPGLTLPSNLKFRSFTRKNGNGTSDLLLHSSTHPTIDFTASENNNHSDKHLKHYVAVFDPETGDLEVAEARRVTARGSVRQRALEEEETEDDQPVTNYSTRAVLTNTFGTKKSKKAVQSMAENRLLARGGEDGNDPIAQALLSSMPEADALEEVDTKQLAQSNKPLPVPNISTNDVNEVYPPSALVFPAPAKSTLKQMPTAAWVDAIAKGKPILTSSRFISNRTAYLVRAHAKQPADKKLELDLQLLRYTLLLIEVANYLRALKRHSRIPDPASWPSKTVSGLVGHDILNGIITRFFGPRNQIQNEAMILLHTTILALTLQIPPPSLNPGANVLVVEPSDIQIDLGLEPRDAMKYYRELGCKLITPSDGELVLWGLEKVGKKRKISDGEGGEKTLPKPKFARLSVPLVFPTLSVGRPSQRR